MSTWIRCTEQMPESGVPVIVFVPTCDGRPYSRRLRAAYAAPKTLPSDPDSEDGEYDEDTDEYYCPEGWYEENDFEEPHWRITDPVTHWMPMPEGPED